MRYWPGLEALWQQGDLRGLLWAFSFATAVNLALVSTLVWPQWLEAPQAQGLWILTAAIWAIATYLQRRQAIPAADPTPVASDRDDALFIQAQTEYLKGNYDEAQWLLRQRLAVVPRDAEARLLLATAYRRSGQSANAREQLTTLQRFDQSAPWAEEIDREFARLSPDSDKAAEDVQNSESAKVGGDSTAEPQLHKMNTPSIRRAA
jgi:thioredoxin-like negative regulator of GroEL